MKEELKLQLDCLMGEKDAGKLNIIADFIDKYFIEREEVKQDLLEIADKGELEDLRREVTNYFNNLDKE